METVSALNVDLSKGFPGRIRVEVRFQLPLEPPSVLILFGPSGSGKTTVLRCLAGLEWPDRGVIQFGRETWLDVRSGIHRPPQKRQVGYMFQDYALFPTQSVEGNIAFGLGDLSLAERKQRVAEVLPLVQLQGLGDARPEQLSGGQQQRVALARAIARRPRLLLLDEPLSALDAPTRDRLRGELRYLLTHLGIPSLVVTHDWGEALAIGDRMAVISEGKILQFGTPQEIFNRPRDAEVARIVGMETAIQGRIVDSSGGLVTVDVSGARLFALVAEGMAGDVFVCIRAEDVVLEKGGTGASSARNRLIGTVRTVTAMGALVKVEVDCGFPLSAIVTRSAVEDLDLVPGMPIAASMKAGAVHLVPRGRAVADVADPSVFGARDGLQGRGI